MNRAGSFVTVQFQSGSENSSGGSSVQLREDYGMALGVAKKATAADSQNILPK